MDLEVNIDIKEEILNYLIGFKKNLIESKKYWIMFLILVSILSLSLFKPENYSDPNVELIVITLVSIMGIFSITTYFQYGSKELHKTVFVIILIFGLLCSLITPIDSIPDETEHAYRAEITSRGVLFPEPVNGEFSTIGSMSLFHDSVDQTVYQTNWDTNKINHAEIQVGGVFQHEPFFGYIFSGLGMFIAKLLDLNVIWMLWLGRMFNALLYAGLISFAIKKTPILKIPLAVISCLPLCLYQAYSLSIDGLIIGFGILIVACFFNMCENKFNKRDLIFFTVLCIVIGFCKVTYFGLILLILFLPRENFENEGNDNFYLYCLAWISLVVICGILWSKLYATPALYNSWRAAYMIQNNINPGGQIQFILSHPFDFFINFWRILPNSLYDMFDGMFNLYLSTYDGFEIRSRFSNILLTMTFGFICLGYPIEKKFKLKNKLGALLTFIGVYVITCISVLLTWCPVGQLNFVGIQARYFLPLLALVPFICNINLTTIKNNTVDNYIMVLLVFFISAMVISLTFVGYY